MKVPVARHPYSFWLPVFIVMAIGLTLTTLVVTHQALTNTTTAQHRFAADARIYTRALSERLTDYVEIATGMRNLFLVEPELTRTQFEHVAATYETGRRYPEVRNISFVRTVDDRPSGVHYVVQYVWPKSGNEGVIGLDIATQPENLAALEQARRTGGVSISSPFQLVQNHTARSFIVRVPVFATGHRPGSRNPELLGAVGVVVEADKMLESVVTAGALHGVTLRVSDTGPLASQADSPRTATLLGSFGDADELSGTPAPLAQLTRIEQLPVLGRRWQLAYASTRSLLSSTELLLPWWEAGTGMIVTLLLAAMMLLFSRTRDRALARAEAAQDAQRRSDARFDTIFNQHATGVAMTDAATGAWLRVNQRYCNLLGYSPQEMQGLNFQKITHPDDLGRDLMLMEQLRAGEIASFTLAKRMLRKDGRTIWVNLTVTPIWQSGDAPSHYVAVLQDITAQQLAQESLRQSERRLNTILDHLPIALVLVAEDERITYRNRRFEAQFGYTADNLPDTASWWTQAYPESEHEDARERWRNWCAQAQANRSGIIEAREDQIRRSNGQLCPVRISGVSDDGYLVILEDLSEHRAAQEQIEFLAFYDPLTRLPNQHALLEHIEGRLDDKGQPQWGALLLLDIDRFKLLNETRGRECGDLLLTKVAGRLLFYGQQQTMVGRHGDDEFVVLLENLAPRADEAGSRAAEQVRHILEMLQAPYALPNGEYHISVCAGITLFRGAGVSVTELLKRADLAVTQAKTTERGSYRFYDPATQRAVNERANLEADLRHALAQGEFALFYQPQVEDGTIIGAEALVRWNHPQKGHALPASFIPLAEETGLIIPLGDWVLRTACAQLARWSTQPGLRHLTISVNVSPHQFYQNEFVSQVLTILAQTGADPTRLRLELTEGLLLKDVEGTITKMALLRARGVSFALDDFGTGYSSLAYLKRLPLQELKIDQHFVRNILEDPKDAAIALTILTLGNRLGLRVIAEGVETTEQRAFLEASGCRAWQGYLLSRAVPAPQFEALLQPRTIYRTHGLRQSATDPGTDPASRPT